MKAAKRAATKTIRTTKKPEPKMNWLKLAESVISVLESLPSEPDYFLNDSGSGGLLGSPREYVSNGEIIWTGKLPAAKIRTGTMHARDFPLSHKALDLLALVDGQLNHHIDEITRRDLGPPPPIGGDFFEYLDRVKKYQATDDIRAALTASVLIRHIHSRHFADSYERQTLPINIAAVARTQSTAQRLLGERSRDKKSELEHAKIAARRLMPLASNHQLLGHLEHKVGIVTQWDAKSIHWRDKFGCEQATPYPTFSRWARKKK